VQYAFENSRWVSLI